MLEKHKNWRIKNLLFLIASLVLLVFLMRSEIVKQFILNLGGFGYIGAFIAGIFFDSIFTVASSIFVLLTLATKLNHLEMAVIAGLGAVIGDYLIYEFFRHDVYAELAPIFSSKQKKHLLRIFKMRYFNWLLIIVGAIIIASPLPDELGLSLLGLSKIKKWQFILISFSLNTLGIFIIISLLN